MAAPRHSRSVDTVLAIPELLEIILLNVDMTTLLVSALRVNRSWNVFITSSTALQQALYFSPSCDDSPPESLDWDPTGCVVPKRTSPPPANAATIASPPSPPPRRPVFNPLLERKFGPCFFDFGSSHGFFRRTDSFYTMPWTSRPHQTVPTDNGGRYHPLYRLVKPMNLGEDELAQAHEDRRRFTRKGASWRRMLVSQPPPPPPPSCEESSVGYLWWMPDGPYGGPEKLSAGRLEVAAVVKRDDCDADRDDCHGRLTMGELYDLVQYHAGHHEQSLWFRVTWGAPKPPYVTRIHQLERQQLASGRAVVAVVEFLEFEDDTWFLRRETQGMETFDKAFRCEEAKPSMVKPPTPRANPPGPNYPDEYDMDILQSFVISTI